MKILLVEDNPLNQKIVSFILNNRGHSIFVAQTGKEAITHIKNTTFDLIIMDLILPDINGLEVTKKIRKLEQKENRKTPVRIIALTANTLENDREKCLQSGMNDYIEKPFNTEQFINLVENN